MTFQNITNNSSSTTQANENFDAVAAAGMYGKRAPAVSGLTWAYYGGRGFGNAIADGTVALTASATNYVAANRSTGAVSVSTATTNWNDTANYYRCYMIVTGSSSITSATDYREFVGGTSAGTFTGGTLTSALNEAPPVTLASAATVNIGAAASNSVTISGTTTITAFDTIAAGALRHVTFSGILTLTYNATSMQLPGSASITTAAGDVAEMVSMGGGNWKCNAYERASGAALVGAGFTGGTLASPLNEAPQVTLASAATVNIGAAGANSISISGTTAITAFDTIASGAVRRLVFQGALTFTHNATSLILPGSANITTAAGDVAEMESLGSGNWRCFNYARANGSPVAGASGLTNWTEAVNSTSPNASIPVVSLTPNNAATNVDIALTAKGVGSLMLQVPTGTTGGGDKRGTSAIDLQTKRTASSQVASGQDSVTIGTNNTASSASAIAIGTTHTVSGTGSAIAVGGSAHTVSGFGGTAVGGTNNSVDGNRAIALGGQYQSSKGITGIATFGAAGQTLASAGKVQGELYSWAVATTNATTTAMGTNGNTGSSANQAILANNSVVVMQGQVVARQVSVGDAKAWTFTACVKRGANAASTALIGTPTVTVVGNDSGAAAWTVAITADTTNGGLAIQVTGEASKSLQWSASATAAYCAG